MRKATSQLDLGWLDCPAIYRAQVLKLFWKILSSTPPPKWIDFVTAGQCMPVVTWVSLKRLKIFNNSFYLREYFPPGV